MLDYPSIYVTRSLYESYEYDFRKKLNRTLETRKQENLLIDAFLNTNEMDSLIQMILKEKIYFVEFGLLYSAEVHADLNVYLHLKIMVQLLLVYKIGFISNI